MGSFYLGSNCAVRDLCFLINYQIPRPEQRKPITDVQKDLAKVIGRFEDMQKNIRLKDRRADDGLKADQYSPNSGLKTKHLITPLE